MHHHPRCTAIHNALRTRPTNLLPTARPPSDAPNHWFAGTFAGDIGSHEPVRAASICQNPCRDPVMWDTIPTWCLFMRASWHGPSPVHSPPAAHRLPRHHVRLEPSARRGIRVCRPVWGGFTCRSPCRNSVICQNPAVDPARWTSIAASVISIKANRPDPSPDPRSTVEV